VPDKRQPHHTHDRGYRDLLSSKRAFLELLKQFAAWLSHVFKARLPGPLRDKVDGIVSEVNPWEVEKMITNLEITLEEMQQQREWCWPVRRTPRATPCRTTARRSLPRCGMC